MGIDDLNFRKIIDTREVIEKRHISLERKNSNQQNKTLHFLYLSPSIDNDMYHDAFPSKIE